MSTIALFQDFDREAAAELVSEMDSYKKKLKAVRKAQIKRIKNHEIGTRNSQLYLNHLGELRDLAIFTSRLVKIYEDLIVTTENGDSETGDDVISGGKEVAEDA